MTVYGHDEGGEPTTRTPENGDGRGSAMTLAETLAAAETAAPVESLDVIARMLKEQLGAASVSFLITDFTGGSVVRLGAAGSVETDEPARRITLRDTLYDDVIRTQRPSVEDKGDGALVQIVAPVTNRGDAIGLLELFLPAAPDAEVMRAIGETAHALAYIVIANRSFTDVYQWGRRTTPLSLAAEIQHRLLPASLSCEAAQFAVAGALEPADHVGGDTFDYVIDRDTVQLSVTDAMGHDVDAARRPSWWAPCAGPGEPVPTSPSRPARPTRPCGSTAARATSPANYCVSASSTAGPSSSTPGTPGRCGCGTDRCGRSLRRSICRSASMPRTDIGSSRWTCVRATGW